MKIALISDLHASLIPLEAVLADIARAGADRTVCLGDLVDLGPQPREVIARVRSLGIPCLLGNHDVLEGEPLEPAAVNAWCRGQLTDEDRRFLDSLPPSLELTLDGGARLLCVHGSPRSFDDQLLSTTSDATLDRWLEGVDADIVAAGHTHLQLLRRHRGRTLVNAGSVGMPFVAPYDPKNPAPPRICPWAEYAIVGDDAIELRRVRYDFEAFAHDIRASGLPDAEAWIRSWVR